MVFQSIRETDNSISFFDENPDPQLHFNHGAYHHAAATENLALNEFVLVHLNQGNISSDPIILWRMAVSNNN